MRGCAPGVGHLCNIRPSASALHNGMVLVAYCPFLGEHMADADLDFLVSLGFRPPGQVCSTDRPPLEYK